jgi:hypothetical protein
MPLNELFQIAVQGNIEFALNTDNERVPNLYVLTNKSRNVDATKEYVALVHRLKG